MEKPSAKLTTVSKIDKGSMRAEDYIKKTREYLENHIDNVRRAYNMVIQKCSDMKWAADSYASKAFETEIRYHDLSKLGPEEFIQYRDNFFPSCDYDKANSGFACAWEHHKANNTHHHETAKTDYDIVHMVIDWVAMSLALGGTAQEFYGRFKESMTLPQEHTDLVNEIFKRLA